jgi:DNA-binding MarR family transcriptional regulator
MVSADPHAGFDVERLLLQCHRLERSLAASAGLSVDEFHSLAHLYVHAPCYVKNLCELTGIHPTRVSRILSGLERKGLLTRTLGIEDKRKESLALTEAGVGVARGLLQSCALSRRGLAGALPSGEPAQRDLSEDFRGVTM